MACVAQQPAREAAGSCLQEAAVRAVCLRLNERSRAAVCLVERKAAMEAPEVARRLHSADAAVAPVQGYGLVRFTSAQDAQAAIEKFHGTELEGRTLTVRLDKCDACPWLVQLADACALAAEA